MSQIGWTLEASYLDLPPTFFTQIEPTPVRAPMLVLFNHKLAAELGLSIAGLTDDDLAQHLGGNATTPETRPFAQAYAGHQFGGFSILGDGRAHVLGEHVTPDGKRVDLQLKGSGPTPYSRRGDGRAALGPMLREYIISEAMAALGIPTTRSLAVVATGEPVIREAMLPGAVLTRVAASHLRVGTFQFAAVQRDTDLLKALVDYALARHFPERLDSDNRALALLSGVVARQAALIVQWLRVGFIHGVMNTDNMTISGETIDYGPCAFMDNFDPDQVFSSIDYHGRYAFMNQPPIAQWNLARLTEALLPLIDSDSERAVTKATQAVEAFGPLFTNGYQAMMRAKLGLVGHEDGDEKLVEDLLTLMQSADADYTNTFRKLARGDDFGEGAPMMMRDWSARWQARLSRNTIPRDAALALMQRTNPAIIPRNHKVEQALTAANTGDLSVTLALLAALADPYADRADRADYLMPPEPAERVMQTFCGT
jgi:serine/tyrosine/threonine adenylyltransferase